ncbi:MAG: ammonia channel protein [Gemmatimonadetes bacterium]|nr:ammonia channel protein [Gemmatimonadota bacterium]
MYLLFCGIFLSLLLLPTNALAENVINSGDTAWIFISSGLVLFMMVPGLAMFYAGLVQKRNVLSVFMHCFGITAIVTIIWTLFGYSVAFSEGNEFLGDLSKAFMQGISGDNLSGTIPELAFFIFQMTFAIITPGLIVGAFAERMKFSAVMWFSCIWCVLVYLPITHMVWGPGGYFGNMGVKDFAGGIVVHITAGTAALIAAVLVGKRSGYPEKPMPPHNMTMNLIGTAMLWVGWFGFNGGSALAANGQAAMAIVVTQISPSVAALVWIAIEWVKNGKPSALGFATGAIAGLAAITPAAGWVGPMGAIVIGAVSSLVAYWAATWLKQAMGYDDALDVVGVHGFGGLVGTILVSFFASSALGGSETNFDSVAQLKVQVLAVVATIIYTAIISYIILKVIDVISGLRVSDEVEVNGLDLGEHGEVGYDS